MAADDADVAAAKGRLDALVAARERRLAAEKELARAARSETLSWVESALRSAERAGVDGGSAALAAGRLKRDELKRQAAARAAAAAALGAATGSDDAGDARRGAGGGGARGRRARPDTRARTRAPADRERAEGAALEGLAGKAGARRT